jgi:hypothetical protein
LYGGYLEFGWIDIRYQVAYGNIIPEIVRAKAQRLKCTDPRIIKKFNDCYEAYLLRQKIKEKHKTCNTPKVLPLYRASATGI